MRYIEKIVKSLIILLLLVGCSNYHTSTNLENSDDKVTISLNFDIDFANKMLTKSSYNIATPKETELTNPSLYIFTNHNPISATSPDPNGQLMLISPLVFDEAKGEHITRVYPIEAPVTALGIANLPADLYANLKRIYETGDPLTYEQFVNMSILPLQTIKNEYDSLVISPSNTILENTDNGILPVSVDPIMLPELTKEIIDLANIQNPTASNSRFGYSRLDVVLEMHDSIKNQITLIEAMLVNVPTLPNFTGRVGQIPYATFTNPVSPETNVNTPDMPNARIEIPDPTNPTEMIWVPNDDIIQGLYMYPNTVLSESATNQVSVIIKARNAESIEDEYYKVLVRYQDNPDGSYNESGPWLYSINRNTRYKLRIFEFRGNGYATVQEALTNPPSNLQFDIEVDSSTGNEFIVTNGSSYMALSNTVVDLFGKKDKLSNEEFVGFTVFYKSNPAAEDENSENKAEFTTEVSTTSPGLTIVNKLDFEENYTEGTTDTVYLKIDNDFLESGSITLRIGNLVSNITVNFIDFQSNATTINRYDSEEFTYAYLEYNEKDIASIATWIRFNNTAQLEYPSPDGDGVPITLTALTTGYRDNFESPAIIYNEKGASIRAYIQQENLREMDFSNADSVSAYIGGSFATKSELVLSNCYILNPHTSLATKYYIPISTRIKEVWENYASEDEARPYMTNGVFTLPEDWDVEVVWYDSQLVYDAGLEFKKEIDPMSEEQRISVIIPAEMENFGNILVAVTDGAGNYLWCWSFWITDYDPMAIARKADPSNGLGAYVEGGVHVTPANADPNIDAIHHYGTIAAWDKSKTTGYCANRFIMDRNHGVLNKTPLGYGTVYNSTNSAMITDPVSGFCVFQHGNPRPIVGVGALDSQGQPFDYTIQRFHVSIIKSLQNPDLFYSSPTGYGTWNSSTSNSNTWVWFDT